jgi:hypothetical protein
MSVSRIVKDHKSHRMPGKILQSGKCREDVFPIKSGGKYINRESWYNRGTGQVEDREWSEGPSNAFCKGHLRVIVSSTEAYRQNFDAIQWEKKTEVARCH